MKRGILAFGGLTLLLALPVAAEGDSGDSVRALRGDNFHISFALKSRDGEPTAIRRFKFSQLTAECAGGATVEVRGRIRFIEVHDNRRFSEALNHRSAAQTCCAWFRRKVRQVWLGGRGAGCQR